MNHQPSWRKPFGILVLLLMIAAWAFLVVTIAEVLAGLPELVRAAYYLVAGIIWLWILPLKPLLQWMETGHWPRRGADRD